MKKQVASIVLTLAWLPVAAAAQQKTDTLDVQRLGALVVTAERVSAPVKTGVNAVSRLTRADLSSRSVRTLAEAVQQVPGVAFVDFEGSFADPQAIVRGFYGGGEADYMLLLVDGRPLNALETGRINWDLVPVSAIESIEVVRGASSAAWGDAALGGVINVITRQPNAAMWRGSVRGGSNGTTRVSGTGYGAIGTAPVSAFIDFGKMDGFRTHAERSTRTLGITIGGTDPERGFSLTTMSDWREYDDPGALTGTELAASRTQSSPFHRFDRNDEWMHRLTVSSKNTLGAGRLSSSLTGELREGDRIRTVRLAPEFADTKNRVLSTQRLSGTTELEFAGALTDRDDLLLGVDASYGRITSDYYNFAQGPADAYAGLSHRGELNANASGNRSAAAGFARYGLQATSALRLTVAGRLDWLRDEFETDATQSQTPEPRTHAVFSPRAGANLQYVENGRQSGHIYANIARSFKAPTPDQLYDRRLLPVPFEPYQISLSNAQLDPQHGVSYEAGVYHEAVVAPGAVSADLSLAVYQIDLRDEIDFDVSTYSYKNLGKSQHRGIEAGLNLRGPHTISGFANYTLQAAIYGNGDNDGNYLKAIPRHFIVAGLSAGSATSLSGTISATTARKTYLDDANTVSLADWTRWDARLAYRWRDVLVSVDAFNLLNDKYNTTGFPDAASSEVYYYPAARRTLQFGLTWGG